MITSNDSDSRVDNIVAYNDIPKSASILNTIRDPNRTTAKYVETDDVGVVKALNEAGWFIKSYSEVGTRRGQRQGFQKYLAIYENLDLPSVKEGRPRLLQRGSHDGTSRLELFGGFFTFACANGLIVGNSVFDPIAVKHIGNIPQQVVEGAEKFVDVCPLIFNKIEQMSRKVLSPFEAINFAKQAIELRFEDKYTVQAEDILRPRRTEDDNPSLWSVFNRVQENLFNPYGFKATSTDNKTRKVRKVNNIDVTVKLNTGLWHLSESFLVQ